MQGLKISSSVGPGGRNARHDVALVQLALRKAGLFSGTLDGQYRASLGKVIEQFLMGKGLARGALLSPGGVGIKALAATVPAAFKHAKTWQQTPYIYVVTNTIAVDPWKRGDRALPDAEFNALKRGLKQSAFVRQLGLGITDVTVTADGRFMVRLGFQGVKFVDPVTAKLTALPPKPFLRLLQNDLPLAGWQAVMGSDLIFKTSKTWSILKQAKDVTLEQLELIGLKKRPSRAVLATCSAAIVTNMLSDKPDERQARDLMQCFGQDRLTMEQKVKMRQLACRDLHRKWSSVFSRLERIHEALRAVLPLYAEAYKKRVLMGQARDARTAENIEIGLHNSPGADTVTTLSDILQGNKTLGEVVRTVVTGADAPDAAIRFLESAGKETSAGLLKAFDLASLWYDTQKTFANALQNTTELPEWYRLIDLQIQLWVGFYNGFAELEEIWPEQVRLLEAMHAVKCPIPKDDYETIWLDLLSLHRTLFGMQPILYTEEHRRLRDVRGHRDKYLIWPE